MSAQPASCGLGKVLIFFSALRLSNAVRAPMPEERVSKFFTIAGHSLEWAGMRWRTKICFAIGYEFWCTVCRHRTSIGASLKRQE